MRVERLHADHLLPMGDRFEIHSPGFVDVAGGRVVASGGTEEAPPLEPDGVEQHLGGVLLPGLINCHAHSAMTVLRGAGEGLPLERWLAEVIWPREARMTPADVHVGMLVGAAEMLLGGITTTAEMYFHPEVVAEACAGAGIRALVAGAVVDAPGWDRFGSPAQMLADTVALASRWQGDDLVEIALGPHSAYTLDDATLRDAGAAAAETGMLLHIHVAETATEGDAVRQRTGRSVPAHLAELGVLRGRALAAHGVWLDDADIALLASAGTGVAHCPGSNGKLASGLAPVRSLRAAGVPVGIATDGPASNNNLDLWEEALLALLYSRLREGDAAALGVEDALRMMTSEAAAALGRSDLGALVPGRRADLIRISLDPVACDPVLEPGDVPSHLIWSGREVTDVWVEGRPVVRDRACLTVNTTAAREDLRRGARRLAGG